MGRLRLMGLVAAMAACVALCAPAIASAANMFTWSQPGDFTATAPGANPEHKYGEPSWSYSPATFDSSFTGADGSTTYSGWVDSSSSPTTWIGVPASGTPSTLQMVPPDNNGSVSLTWTAPAAEQVTITGTLTEPNYSTALLSPCAGTTWSLTNGGATVASGSGAGSTNDLDGSATVAAGGTLVLTVTDASSVLEPYSTSCDDTEVQQLQLSAPAPSSAVTLTSPTAHQTFTNAQPTFSGKAGDGFGYQPGVTVKVYSGSTISGTAVQTLTTTESGGSWSASPTALANGTYTAEATQADILGNTDTSSPVTFTINNPAPPTVTLNSLGTGPLSTATPTFTGTAGTATGDSSVSVFVAPAAHPNQAVAYTTATVGSNGAFSAKLPSALADGQYVAVAIQDDSSGGVGSSPEITFSIKIHPPAVTLTTPAAGASVAQHGATFTGTATDVYGDSSTVKVSLWSGTSDTGAPTSTENAPVTGTTWSITWPHKLALGLYTIRATQSDDAGHTAYTAVHTFLIVPSPTVVGDAVTITRSGEVSVPVSCPAPAGSTCKASVLIVTTKSYQPTAGGVKGQLKLMFDYVNIKGGETVVVRQHISGAVKRLVLKKAPLSVRVVVAISSGGAKPVTNSGTRTLKITK